MRSAAAGLDPAITLERGENAGSFGAQRFLAAFSGICPHFRPRRHLLSAAEYRHEMDSRFSTWNQVVACPPHDQTANQGPSVANTARVNPAAST
jgi:hypothetical protein